MAGPWRGCRGKREPGATEVVEVGNDTDPASFINGLAEAVFGIAGRNLLSREFSVDAWFDEHSLVSGQFNVSGGRHGRGTWSA